MVENGPIGAGIAPWLGSSPDMKTIAATSEPEKNLCVMLIVQPPMEIPKILIFVSS
jgi:hypothetical protein